MTKYKTIFDALAAQFEPGQVKIRHQAGRSFSYVTARTVMNRLDAVLGPENWSDEYTPLERSVICRLTVRLPDGSTVTKSDAGGMAGMSDAGDDDKSGYSDAFKRAAVKFGVSRYLYGDGVADLGGPTAAATAAPVASPPPGRPAVKAGSEDAQGRGGKLVHGQAAARKPAANAKPRTGEELHFYAMESTLDPGLANWIINSFNPMGYPDRLLDWTPGDVARAWPSIREHLVVAKQARERMKAAS